jgi:hypothetical protein
MLKCRDGRPLDAGRKRARDATGSKENRHCLPDHKNPALFENGEKRKIILITHIQPV